MKTIATFLVLFVAWSCLAAPLPPGITGKQINQYPNAPSPGATNLLLLDPGNGAYLNSSIGQISSIFGSPNIVTNNTFVNTNVTILNSNVFINNEFVTNVTVEVPGGFTNLNLTASTVMYADANKAESSIPNSSGVLTNDGSGAVGFNTKIQLDEIDATSFYPTNMFTGLTNVSVLGTDGNGLLVIGSSVITNVTITNAFINLLTNNIFVNTNLFISTSNAYFTNNTFINTNFSTNLFFVSGKGNTLIITNNFSVGGVQTNLNIAASSAVITKADQVLTNAVNAHGVFTNSATGPPSFGLLQNTELVNSSITIQGSAVALGGTTLGAGSSPTFNLVNSTNLTYQYVTNASPSSAVLAFGQAYETNLTTDVTLLGFSKGSAFYETVVYSCTNSGGVDHKVTMPAGVVGTPGSGTPPSFYVTNKFGADIFVSHWGDKRTNAWKIDWAP